jgi:membrane dipeptidase
MNSTCDRATALLNDTLVWDAHACLPLRFNQDMGALERHRGAGVNYVSVNVGMDINPVSQVIRVIAGFRAWLTEHTDHFLFARTVEDIRRAKVEGKLAVGFDLEGSVMLDDDVAMLALYRDLGVRQIHLAYNRDNSIAGGCHGADIGLTPLGRQVVAEINRLGLIMDCSHSGYRTSMEIMERSTRPVVYSHSNVRALRDHPRNLRDEQIDACARTDGVIGLSGIGNFIGEGDVTTESLVRHLDYVVQRVGPRHVGLGLDYVFGAGGPGLEYVFEQSTEEYPSDFNREDWWPAAYYGDGFHMVPPERFPEIVEALLVRGYSDGDVGRILGGNFLRVAQVTWPA